MSFTHRRVRLSLAAMAMLLLIFGIVSSFALCKPQQVFASSGGGFNTPGNVLISDQFNNRVVEVDRNTKQVVWSFGSGNRCFAILGPVLSLASTMQSACLMA